MSRLGRVVTRNSIRSAAFHSPINIAIRALTQSDITEADRIARAAFRTNDSRRADLNRYLVMQPDSWFVAECDGKITGTGGSVDFGAFAYLGGMAVDPPMQRRGIARAMMHHILAQLKARGQSTILLDASAYGAPLYASLDFVEHGQVQVFQNDSPQRLTTLPTGVTRMSDSDIPMLAELDSPIYGGSRARVFQAYLADLPERAFVVRAASGQITGFTFAQPGRIGPWVSKNVDDAEKLLRAALSVDYGSMIQVLTPSPNSRIGDLLMRYGFQFVRLAAHMYRGEIYPARQRELIYGQASFGIG